MGLVRGAVVCRNRGDRFAELWGAVGHFLLNSVDRTCRDLSPGEVGG